jgi:hypothetical protein
MTLLRRNGGDESMESTLSLLDAQEAVLLPEREELITIGNITVTLMKTVTVHRATVNALQVIKATNYGGVFGGNSQTALAAGTQTVTVVN